MGDVEPDKFSKFEQFDKNHDGVITLDEAFLMYDRNSDGVITTEDLEMRLGSSGRNFDLKQSIKQLDADGSGGIDFTEFISAFGSSRRRAKRAIDDKDIFILIVLLVNIR